ncbi:hypothetical protein B0H34DRAFT_214166 [Crassisporium funariophilum]|nr:hypothetical protein B0H34DRAFT_214166 [Crassisporium funariophilum]
MHPVNRLPLLLLVSLLISSYMYTHFFYNPIYALLHLYFICQSFCASSHIDGHSNIHHTSTIPTIYPSSSHAH